MERKKWTYDKDWFTAKRTIPLNCAVCSLISAVWSHTSPDDTSAATRSQNKPNHCLCSDHCHLQSRPEPSPCPREPVTSLVWGQQQRLQGEEPPRRSTSHLLGQICDHRGCRRKREKAGLCLGPCVLACSRHLTRVTHSDSVTETPDRSSDTGIKSERG